MNKTVEIDGYTVNIECGKDGSMVRSATVLVGEDKPGLRVKDAGSRAARQTAKQAVMAALNLPDNKVRVQARYSCLAINRQTGILERKDDSGRIVGAHPLVGNGRG